MKKRHEVGSALLIAVCLAAPAFSAEELSRADWQVDFFDDFHRFDPRNWVDHTPWVNDEDHCYVTDNQFNTREVSNGTLKLRVVDLGEKRPCNNLSKTGVQHPDTQYVAARIASKNRREFVKGRWTARLRVQDSGQDGMFPAWWLLGALNNEAPVEDPDETVCWPMFGSGEIDIFEHHSDGGPDHYAARAIVSNGVCGDGDWRAMMLVQEASLAEYHEYSVEWLGDDLIYRLDDVEVYRNAGMSDALSEPFFAILNFAKINDATMDRDWVMEVDWVKHEYLP
ncbi:glycoside hydrolase family 16 protein [Congregibacter sp.]|uniref:glycoside hydrolase family 16 protein n=1 Tax=Congregibacter sp. TaxID=2744308 RepID=UPI003F6AAA1A